MQLLRLTNDDPNFQAYLKQRLVYLLDKVSPSHTDHLKAEKCKQQISTQMKDRKVAGYYTSQDRPEFQRALQHVIYESQTGIDPTAERRKHEVAAMIKGIRDEEDAKNKALDE